MRKLISATMLVAGTCIGSGMIALPMLLAKLGIIPSIALMIITWIIVYYTSLVSVELNLQAGKGLALGDLGKKFSGKISALIGTSSFKTLSYALLAVYLSGGASIMQKLLEVGFDKTYQFNHILAGYTILVASIILLPLNLLLYLNKIFFLGLFGAIAILIISIMPTINLEGLPLIATNYNDVSILSAVIPVVFTSFGFQVIFHTLTDYCNKDKIMLKRAFYWGSLIPALIYIIWTVSILCVVYQNDKEFYQLMMDGKIAVGDLIEKLSNIAKWPLIQAIVWCLSSLAIITSIVGVGIGLRDSLSLILTENKVTSGNKLWATLLAVIPAYIVAAIIPNAFIAVLGFAGMILVIIAILLPIYLLTKVKTSKFNYPELSASWLIWLSAAAGLIIIICEIYNMLG